MKILHVDIETAPMAVYSWSLFPKFIPIGQVIHPVQMMCWAAKFHGEKKVHFRSVHHDDRETMVKDIASLLDQADAVCHWNGDRFDVPHLNREILLAGLTPREAKVLRMRFGLDDGNAKNLREIGDRLGVSKERVRQIEEMALAKLREEARSEPWRDADAPPANPPTPADCCASA